MSTKLMPKQGYDAARRANRQAAGLDALCMLSANLLSLIVIVIIVLLLSQEDLEVGKAS